MTDPASLSPCPLFFLVGENDARAFSMSARDRANALAVKAGLEPAELPDGSRGAVIADLGFTWDPAWLRAVSGQPGTVLVKDGAPVIAHVPAGGAVGEALAALREGRVPPALAPMDADQAELSYHELRKRDRPFVMRLEADRVDAAERAAYDASYKGVTDLLTLYLWRRLAFLLTRWSAKAGLTPNQITFVGAVFCIATFFLWWNGWWWTGVATAFAFMVLDTVDGKLARCTGQSSKWGNLFDHGVDLVHPPFWWWAWAEGLNTIGDPFETVYEALVIGAIVLGYVVSRLIEGSFVRRYKMHIHVWRPIDSRFRLITARRNPNMIILVVSLLFGRPDVGLEYVAFWTLFSLVFHAVRLAQANDLALRGKPVTSWLA